MAKLLCDDGEVMEIEWSELPEDVRSNVLSWQKHLFDRVGGEHFVLVTTRKKSVQQEEAQADAQRAEEPA